LDQKNKWFRKNVIILRNLESMGGNEG